MPVKRQSSIESARKSRISLMFENENEMNDQGNPSTSNHIEDQGQLKYWMKKASNTVFFMIQKIKKNYEETVQRHNDLIMKINDYEDKFKMLKKRYKVLKILNKQQRTQESSGLEQGLTQSVKSNLKVVITKKFSNPPVFIHDKKSNIDEWLLAMKNKMNVNKNWYLTKTMKKAYVRTRLEDDVMKHLTSRFKKDIIKSFDSTEKIFDKLNRIFEDSNKRMNAMKGFCRLKQIDQFREFHAFWSKFQRLASDAEIFDELALLKDLKNKMSFDLQRILASEVYKAIDLHEFARLCQFIGQILRDVESKSTRDRDFEYEEYVTAERDTTIIIQTVHRESIFAAQSIDRFISTSLTNQSWRAQSQASDQINEFRCYNCNELEHMSRNCLQSSKSRLVVSATNVREMNIKKTRDESRKVQPLS